MLDAIEISWDMRERWRTEDFTKIHTLLRTDIVIGGTLRVRLP